MPTDQTQYNVSMATRDSLPSHPTKDGISAVSCFTLIRPHQCGEMGIAGRLAASIFTPSETLATSTETGRGYQSI